MKRQKPPAVLPASENEPASKSETASEGEPWEEGTLYELPEEWELFAQVVGLELSLFQRSSHWWIWFRAHPGGMQGRRPENVPEFGLHVGFGEPPIPTRVLDVRLDNLLEEAANREEQAWFTARLCLAVLEWATKTEKDDLAVPANVGALVDAVLERASLLREIVIKDRVRTAEQLADAVSHLPDAAVHVEAMRRAAVGEHDTPKLREGGTRNVAFLPPLLTNEAMAVFDAIDGASSVFDDIQREQPFFMNELLAEALSTLGERGSSRAKQLRESQEESRKSTNIYEPWWPWVQMVSSKGLPGPPALRWLCETVWYDVVRPKLERARKNPAAMVRVVTSQALGLLAHPPPLPRSEGQQSILFPQDSGWSLAPSIDTELLDAVLKGTGDLSSEVAIDLFEWLITAAHKQYVDATGDFRNLVIEGGWSELARLLGATRSGSAEKVRDLALAFAHLRYDLRGWRGNLLTYAETKAAPGRKACVKLTLGEMLVHGFTFTLKEASGSVGLQAREDRQLVPILGKAAVVGSPASYGAQRRMTWGLATLLRSRAVELAREGGVILSPHDWADLANNAGAPRSATLLGKVQAAWEEGDDKKAIPPLIERNGSRVTLHESRRPALDFIKQAGETSQLQSDRARKGVKARSRATRGKKPALNQRSAIDPATFGHRPGNVRP